MSGCSDDLHVPSVLRQLVHVPLRPNTANSVTYLTAASQLTYSTNKRGSFKLPVPTCGQTQQMDELCV